MNATLDAIKAAPEAFAARVLNPKRDRLAEVDGARRRAWSDEARELVRRVSSAPGIAALEATWGAVAAHWWQIAARERRPAMPATIADQPRRVRERLTGRLIRHLASPFDPLLEVWWAGYARGGSRPATPPSSCPPRPHRGSRRATV